MTYVIDRRLNGKNKSAVNRQRFLKRYKRQIQRAVQDAVKQRSITDMERGESVSIPAQDVSEPIFGHGSGGRRTVVHPGNREFIAGDRIPRPEGGAGGGAGAGDASNQGDGEDDFVFQLTQDEFLEVMFEGLELPNLVKRREPQPVKPLYLKGNISYCICHVRTVSAFVPQYGSRRALFNVEDMPKVTREKMYPRQ